MLRFVSYSLIMTVLCIKFAVADSILLVSSYHAENKWTEQCLQGIYSEIGGRHKLEVIYLDTKRTPSEKHVQAADQAWLQYLEKKPALVMLADDNAVKLLAPKLSATNTPVVYYGINDNPRSYFANGIVPKQFVGVIERRQYRPLVRLIFELIEPKFHRVLILFDDSPSAIAHMNSSFRGQKHLEFGEIGVDVVLVDTFEQWQQEVNLAPSSYDAIVMENWYTLTHKDSQTVVNDKDVLLWAGANSKLPTFSASAYSVGDQKLVGAVDLSGTQHGRDAAQMALALLEGQSPKPIHITETNHYYFNHQALNKYGIKLPAEISEVAIFK